MAMRYGYNRGAQLLRSLRASLKLSQLAIATDVQVTRAALASLESGNRGPSLLLATTIQRWAEARGADIPATSWCDPPLAEDVAEGLVAAA